MTTDTASVDALRTRLARAFEVAALRDPGAELAEFEAAVRREATSTDTVAANTNRLHSFLWGLLISDGQPDPEGTATRAVEHLLDSGILLDAAAVRHETWTEGYNSGVADAYTAHEYDGGRTHPARVSPYEPGAKS